MKTAIQLNESKGFETAEQYLADSYDEDTLKWGIKWFNNNREFKRRIRLAELASEDYLCGRYHACIPLLLSLLDGLVNDVSKHVGFFAENVDLTAWDCIVAHESGLQTLTSVLTKGRNKTNEESILVPYRNGILHGRELAFDNKIVAAKCWAALFAARDWAVAIDSGKKHPQKKEEKSWKELLNQISETNAMNKSIEEWKPRIPENIQYLPFDTDTPNIPKNTPEYAVANFLDNWCNGRFGLIADALLYFTDTPKGKKAGLARQDFGRHLPVSFKIITIEDETAAITNVLAELYFEVEDKKITKDVSIRTVYQDLNNSPLVHSVPNGHWKIAQNSFSKIIYAHNL